MFHRFRIVRQYDSVDCALACLKMICQHYKYTKNEKKNKNEEKAKQ